MFDLQHELSSMFGNVLNYYETVSESVCTLEGHTLPSVNDLFAFLSKIPSSDNIRISISDQAERRIQISRDTSTNDYQYYCNKSESDDSFEIEVVINKEFDEQFGIHIYSSDSFIDYLSHLSTYALFCLLSKQFENNLEQIRYTMLDEKVSLFSDYIAFCSCDDTLPTRKSERAQILNKCENASSYLDIHRIRLLPMDFRIQQNPHSESTLVELFNKLESILSYAYVASSAYFYENKLVFFIDPGIAKEIDLNSYAPRGCINAIFYWAFEDNSAMERVSIARNVLRQYCIHTEQIIDINTDVFQSIKSNFCIYQKETIDRYISLKESIAGFIVNTASQLQELIHDLISGLRNNFIAIATFIITALLSNSLTDSDLFIDDLPKNLIFVAHLFILISIMYFLASIAYLFYRKSIIKQNYKKLEENYSDLFDEDELREIFHKNSILDYTLKKINWSAFAISTIWILFIVALTATLVGFTNGNDIINLIDITSESFI